MTRTGSALEVGADFGAHLDRRSQLAFAHVLDTASALSLESVAALAESLPAESVVYEDAVKPLVATGGSTPTYSSPHEAGRRIRTIDENNSWLTLLNIEQSPQYARLIDEHVDAVARLIGRDASALRRRMGFVFVSSPDSVTPAHFDIEHSLCIQLRGERTLTFGAFADEAQREDEIHRYWGGDSYGRLESMPAAATEVALGPGRAVYIPPYTPHWLQNGRQSSLSLTITFFTDSNEDESLVQAFNEKLRKLRVSPRPYGRRPHADRVKARAMRAYSALRRRLKPGSDKPKAR